MFGIIVAGRLVQTDCKQVDENRFVFDLANPEKINYFSVFLTGQKMFPQDYGATVYYMGPQLGNNSWKLLGYLSNEKPSAIFKLRVGSSGYFKDDDMDDDAAGKSFTGIAEIGISIEPLESVMFQVEQNQVSAQPSLATGEQLQLVKAPSVSFSGSVQTIVQNVVENFINHVQSFASDTLPPGASVIGSFENEAMFVPLKSVLDWYNKILNKLKYDPSGEFLKAPSV